MSRDSRANLLAHAQFVGYVANAFTAKRLRRE